MSKIPTLNHWDIANLLREGPAVAMSKTADDKEYIFVVGGSNKHHHAKVRHRFQVYNSVEVYNPEDWTRQEELEKPLHNARYSAGIAVHPVTGVIYVVGGANEPFDPKPLTSVEFFDPKTPDKGWQRGRDLPRGLCGVGIGFMEDMKEKKEKKKYKLYIFGGSLGHTGKKYKTSDQILSWNLNKNDRWNEEKKIKLTPKRYQIASVTINNEIYLIGGYAYGNFTWTNKDNGLTYKCGEGGYPRIQKFRLNDDGEIESNEKEWKLERAFFGAAVAHWHERQNKDWIIVLGGYLDVYEKGESVSIINPSIYLDTVECHLIQEDGEIVHITDSPPVPSLMHIKRYKVGAAVAPQSRRLYVIGGEEEGVTSRVESFLLPVVGD